MNRLDVIAAIDEAIVHNHLANVPGYIGAELAIKLEGAGLVEPNYDKLGDRLRLTVWADLTDFGKRIKRASELLANDGEG